MRKIDLCYRWRCKVGGYFDVGRKKSPPPRLAEEADRAARGNYWRKIFAVVENAAHFDCDFHIFCCWDISVVGRRCTVLWGVENVKDAQPSNFYPATIVNFNGLARATRHLIHFDDGVIERVGLPDDGIKIMTETVKECPCSKCKGEKVPRPWIPRP